MNLLTYLTGIDIFHYKIYQSGRSNHKAYGRKEKLHFAENGYDFRH